MKIFRRLLLLAALVALLIFAGRGIGKLFPGNSGAEIEEAAPADSTTEKAWRKANPWLYDAPEYAAFRENLILPMARRHGLEPRAVRRRGGVVEMTLPLGKPIHDYAWEVESRGAEAGLTVLEGRESATRPASVEYKLKDAEGRALTLRLLPGKGALPGAVRMALVITGLGAASPADLKAWLAFPEGVTLVLPDTSPALKALEDAAEPEEGVAAREIFLELPMEPASYPYVKPGPRALFIDFSRDQAEKVLGERLDAYSGAKGFATVLGDRAIENPPLMESVLGFMASRSLVFLDLTASPRSLTPSASVKTGAESFTARVQEGTSDEALRAELLRRADLARKAGEGVWVLRHAPGLPAGLAALLRREQKLFDELGLRWVPLSRLHEDP